MRFLRKFLYFSIGGGLYTLLECLWRGRSHISMFCLGGGCFLLLGKLRHLRLSLPAKMILGAAGITAGELLTGLLVNRDHRIWDYSRQKLNFKGQICAGYSALWGILALFGMWLHGILEKHFSAPG